MSGDFSNFGRQPVKPSNARVGFAGGLGLYLMFGGAVVVAGAAGALIAFVLMRSPGPPQQSPVNGAQAAAPQAGDPAAPAPPQWTKVATYGSWEVRCQNSNVSNKVCAAWLEVVNQQSKQVIIA